MLAPEFIVRFSCAKSNKIKNKIYSFMDGSETSRSAETFIDDEKGALAIFVSVGGSLLLVQLP